MILEIKIKLNFKKHLKIVNGWRNINQVNTNQKEAGPATLISGTQTLKQRKISGIKKGII